jgi:hypothetical protein
MLTPEALPVLAEITLERDRQIAELGWTPEHDDAHGVAHLERLAVEWAIHASHTTGTEQRDALVKVAALVVAAIEVIDRA